MPKIYKFIKTNFQNTKKKNQIKIKIIYMCVFLGGGVCGEPNWVKQAGKIINSSPVQPWSILFF